MINKIFFGRLIILSILGLMIISCNERGSAARARTSNERHVTIINNTGSNVSAYAVYAGTNGVEINKGTSFTEQRGRIVVLIPSAWDNDLDLEIVLIDISERIYAKTFNVPLRGNTDTPISSSDRVSEGLWTDVWKDLVDWFNRNK